MDRPTRFDYQAKVVCIGNSGVGKSSLALRFCNDEWSPSFISTIGVDFRYRIVDLGGGFRMRLLLWDTAGQERYRSITQAYYRGSIHDWLKDLDSMGIGKSANTHVPKLLIGNKTDNNQGRVVSTEQGRMLAEEMGALFCETSAKYSEGVHEAFMMLAREIKKKRVDVDPVYRFRTVGTPGRSDLGPTSEVIVVKPAPQKRFAVSCCASEQCVGYTEELVRKDVVR